MSLQLHTYALLLATLAALITVSSTECEGSTEEDDCPHVKVLRGRDGRDGRDGLNGAKGEQGPVGSPGHKGDKAVPGIQGPIGISGPQGAAGEKGQRGQQGLHGEKGQQGIQGPIGISGPQGAAGEKGQRGQQGPRGEKGQRGMHGDKGMRGDLGPTGHQGEQGVQGPPSGGVTYTRWGRTNCSTDQGTELVYAGRAGGTHHRHSGGGANYLCLPDDPSHLRYQSGVQDRSYVTGVEYQYVSLPSLSSVNHHNVPCAVCYVANRSVSLMIPAKTQCPTLWTLEYIGYLMTERFNHHRTMYECVDKDPESVPGLNAFSDPRATFHLVEPYCNGLSCPPYNAEKELTCVVCTR